MTPVTVHPAIYSHKTLSSTKICQMLEEATGLTVIVHRGKSTLQKCPPRVRPKHRRDDPTPPEAA